MPKLSNRTKRADGNYSKQIKIGEKPDGKPIRKTFYAKTIKELDSKVSEYRQKLEKGTLSDNENATFGSAAGLWIENYKPNISIGVRKRYLSIIKNHLEELSGIKLKDLKPVHLQKIINRMAENEYFEKTLAEIKQTAVQIMRAAMDNDIVFRNVFERVIIPSIEAEERLPLSEDEISLVTETYTGHRMGLPAMIMLYAGLRRGEMLALTWRDIDLKTKTITMNKSLFFDGNKGQKKSPKTKMGNRVVPIPNVLMDAITCSRKRAEWIFICPAIKSGDKMTNTAFRDAWKSYMHYSNLQAGGRDASRSKPKVEALKSFGAHQLRHSYATMLYDAGVDAKSAQKFLGHADLSTTLKIYTHLSNMKEQKSVDALNVHLGTKMKERSHD